MKVVENSKKIFMVHPTLFAVGLALMLVFAWSFTQVKTAHAAATCPSGGTTVINGQPVCDDYVPPTPLDISNYDPSMCPTCSAQPGVVPSAETIAYNNAIAAANAAAGGYNTVNAGSPIVAEAGELCFNSSCPEYNGLNGTNTYGFPGWLGNSRYSSTSFIINFNNTSNGSTSCSIGGTYSDTTTYQLSGLPGASTIDTFIFRGLEPSNSTCTPNQDLASYQDPGTQTTQTCQTNASGQNTGYVCTTVGFAPSTCNEYNATRCPLPAGVCNPNGFCDTMGGENHTSCPGDCPVPYDFLVTIDPLTATVTSTAATITKQYTVTISAVPGTNNGPIYFDLSCSGATGVTCSYTGGYSYDPSALGGAGGYVTGVGNTLILTATVAPNAPGAQNLIRFNGSIYDDASSLMPATLVARTSQATLDVIGPDSTICDGGWRPIPGGAATIAQPVIKAANTNTNIGVGLIGGDNYVWGRFCPAAGVSTCRWETAVGWIRLPGSPKTSAPPYAYGGSGMSLVLRDISNANSWANDGGYAYYTWDSSWDSYPGDYPWGLPIRAQDANGRYWQVRRNADNTVSYACGLNVCVDLQYNFANSTINGSKDATVGIGNNVNISCDYGSRVSAIAYPIFTGAQNCNFTGWTLGTTQANFTCQATQAVDKTPVMCSLNPGGSENVCASTDIAGLLTVNGPPTNGVCGTANGKAYSSSDTAYAPDTQCAQGTPSTTAFPGIGATVNWTCNGLNGGSNSAQCSASRTNAAVNGVCGTADGKSYPNGTTGYGADTQCSQGAPSSTTFPSAGNSASWTCTGQNGGSDSGTCSASQAGSGGACTPLTYEPATSGFSTNPNGPAQSTISVAPGTTFYTFVDYGAYVDSIQPPSSGSNTCTWSGWVGTAARFDCVAAATPNTYSYSTNINGGTSSNNCASGSQTIGSITVTGGSTPTDPTPGPSCNSQNTTACDTWPQASPVCGEIKITWVDQSTNETGFKIYKDGTLVTTVPSTTSGATGDKYGYVYSTGFDAAVHTYSIAATTGSVDSARVDLAPIAGYPCQANLSSNSDKEITAINGGSIPTAPCNNTSNVVPSTISLKSGDTADFSINLCNSGRADATKVYVTDYLTNLSNVSNIQFCNGGSCSVIPSGLISFSGASPNQIMTINLTGASYNVPNPYDTSCSGICVRKITFTATLDAGTSTANYSRFQNTGTICYAPFVGDTGTCHGNSGRASVGTPLLLFSVGEGSTIRHEVGP